MLSCILDQLVSDLGLVRDVLAADLIRAQAKRTALLGASGAFTPADWANSSCTVIARGIAESTALYLVLVADQRSTSSTAVGALGARDADISHAGRAVRRADAAANIMEGVVALGVVEVAPLFAAWSALMNLACTSAIGIWFIAVSSIVTEARVMGAVLPADWTDTREALLAAVEAKGAILLLAIRAVRKRLTSGATGSLLPARVRNIGVMVVVVVVVKRCAVVVLFCVRKRFLRVAGKVMNVFLIPIVTVRVLASVVGVNVMDDRRVHDGAWGVMVIIIHVRNVVVVVDNVVHDV